MRFAYIIILSLVKDFNCNKEACGFEAQRFKDNGAEKERKRELRYQDIPLSLEHSLT